jgi:hypothetical protein
MKRSYFVLIAAMAAFSQQPGTHPPIANAPKVDIKGKVEKVQATPGQGMPSLEIRSGGKTTRVMLGSMRYLMEQDFNPRAGDEAAVHGYRVNGDVIAISVTVRGKTLRLRDENGWPVWMKGRRGGPPRRGV